MRTIGLVLDPGYGARLAALADHMHLWVVESPANRVAAESVWAKQEPGSHDRGLTLFKDGRQGDWDEARWLGMLNEIELHYGPLSEDPPYRGIEVIGCALSEEIRHWLEGAGFAMIEEMSEGFRADCPPAADDRTDEL